jgi:hypothetical protein
MSSPVVPIHRRDLFGDGTGKTAASGINNYQLMLNYALGHEDSDLLLLPYGPFVNYINGSGGSARQKANAVLRWHKTGEKEMEAPRRLQFHHQELFSECLAKKGGFTREGTPLAASNGWDYPGGKLLSFRQVFICPLGRQPLAAGVGGWVLKLLLLTTTHFHTYRIGD